MQPGSQSIEPPKVDMRLSVSEMSTQELVRALIQVEVAIQQARVATAMTADSDEVVTANVPKDLSALVSWEQNIVSEFRDRRSRPVPVSVAVAEAARR
jgi:hypothetical protein